MERVIDMSYAVLMSPVSALRSVANEEPVGPGLGILFLVSLTGATATNVAIPGVPMQMGFGAGVLTRGIGTFILALLIIGAIHLVSTMFGGAGSFMSLLSSICFAQFPGLLNGPATLLRAIPPLALAATVLSLGIGIWTLVLTILAVRESRGISTGHSILTGVFAVVGISIFGGILAAFAILSAAF